MADNVKRRAAVKQRRGTKRHHSREGGETLEVVCRIKTVAAEQCPQPCVIAVDDELVQLVPVSPAAAERVYRFGHVFDAGDSQRCVFNRCALDLIEDLLRGKNSLLFAYGVTSSGKTYTMTGSPTDPGVLPRTADVLFNSLPELAFKCVFYPDGRNGFRVRSPAEAWEERQRVYGGAPPEYAYVERQRETKCVAGFASGAMAASVFVSYVEIYNDNCYDLLDETLTAADSRLNMAKKLCTDPTGQVYVDKLTEVEVDSADEVLEQYRCAQERRKMAATLLNASSSRSHSVFTIRLVMAPAQPRTNGIFERAHPVEGDEAAHHLVVSQLSLVDLAGSERTKRTCNEGDRLAEAGKINQSLSTLRKCFDQLRENQRRGGGHAHATTVSYRDAKLTHLFKPFFEGVSGRIRMIVCVNPAPAEYDETTFVMGFAELAQTLDIPEVAAPSLPLDCLSGPLPYSRRQIDHWFREMAERVADEPRNVLPTELARPPPFVLDSADDGDAVRAIREFYQKRLATTRALMATTNSNASLFIVKLKQRLCISDLDRVKLAELQHDFDEVQAYNATVNAKSAQMERECNALRQRLYRYDAEKAMEQRRDVEKRVREDEKLAAVEHTQRVLRQVQEVVERPVPTKSHVATMRRKFCASDETIDRAGRVQQQQKVQGNKGRPAATQTPGAATGTRSSRPMAGNAAMVANQGVMNPYYQRRSRSTGALKVLNHQPVNKVPTGTIYQPQLPRGTKHTTQVEMEDLMRCETYVVTDQKVDADGNLLTDLVKGNIVPTAGGGTAVMFHDVECLHQEVFPSPVAAMISTMNNGRGGPSASGNKTPRR